MAAVVASANLDELSALQHTFQTSTYELQFERSSRDFDRIVRDEDVRRLRVEIQLLSDENETLVEELTQEEERAEDLQADLGAAIARVEELDESVMALSNELRVKTRELETMRAEIDSFESMSSDSKKTLKEKLALQSELSKVKPELDHLRAEAATQRELLAEKLSLQREVSTLQVELDNSKRQYKRAKVEKGKTDAQDEDLEAKMEGLHRELLEQTQALKESKRQVDRLQRELSAEKKSTSGAETSQAKASNEEDSFKSRMEELRKELAGEKRERQKVEKALDKERASWEASKSILDDKLGQFRTKLRATKDKLKDTETELLKAQSAPAAATKASRKRSAAEVDPDTAIGTPGDAVPAKRGKRMAVTAPGDKSMFSITPFLNKTTSVALDSPAETKIAMGVIEEENETEATPSGQAKRGPSKLTLNKPLGPAPSQKTNANRRSAVARNKTASEPTLEKETREPAAGAEIQVESVQTATTKIALKDADDSSARPTDALPSKNPLPKLKKPRKSLADISTFNLEDTAAGPKIVKKKRKLLGNPSFLGGGGGAKTLFDEEDGEKLPPKPIPGRGLFGARVLGKSASLLGAKGMLKGPVLEDGGFQFSPLKKDRRAMTKGLLG